LGGGSEIEIFIGCAVTIVDKRHRIPRGSVLIKHSQNSLLRQRICGLGHGYEDLKDHDPLPLAPAWQSFVEQIKPLVLIQPLCRLENRAVRATAWPCMGFWWINSAARSARLPPS